MSHLDCKHIDASMSTLKMYLISAIIAVFIITIVSIVYGLLWGIDSLANAFNIEGNFEGILFITFFITGIFLHEMLHRLGYYAFAHVKKAEIVFGISWKTLAPYTSCKVPVPMKAHRLVGLLPGIILGILPTVICLIFGSYRFLLFLFLMMLTVSCGDFCMLWHIRKYPNNVSVIEHPVKFGCYIGRG